MKLKKREQGCQMNPKNLFNAFKATILAMTLKQLS